MASADRKKLLSQIHGEIQNLENAKSALVNLLNDFAQDARDGFENMPESLQGGEAGQRLEEIADSAENLAGDMKTIEVPDVSEIE